MPVQFESVNSSATRESTFGNGIPYSNDGDIVITGISGRLPRSSNIEEFKENLMKGIDMVSDDDCRWSADMHELLSKYGKIKDLSSFDASFFGIPPKLAHIMDPQARMLLEVTYEAIVDAGVNPMSVRGSRTGVYMGVSYTEAEGFGMNNIDATNGLYLTESNTEYFFRQLFSWLIDQAAYREQISENTVSKFCRQKDYKFYTDSDISHNVGRTSTDTYIMKLDNMFRQQIGGRHSAEPAHATWRQIAAETEQNLLTQVVGRLVTKQSKLCRLVA
ncbi:PREDICTED: probable polyketide synthase 18 [Vollenhovia emeryi]|uniref:probable polyketide synthase 18 n=1 Tax=Vollenhovia emeryi TaxID=411798 RepID=UPI0005F3DBF8|nr:PREDICTED: probable polyketide synthase 18 [Vollenhovia emeryi]